MKMSGYPQSPDLSAIRPESPMHPDIPTFGHLPHTGVNDRFGYIPTSAPLHQPVSQPFHPPFYDQHNQHNQHFGAMPPRHPKTEAQDDEYMPDVTASRRSRRVKQEQPVEDVSMAPAFFAAPPPAMKLESSGDPTLGCKLTTSFPVARIKRIMQADEDVGKVAQVTPTVVSRALELFMIKLISAAAAQAKGSGHGGASKGPRRVLAQHLKQAITMDEKFDFLNEIVAKVPDAPTKGGRKENGSDSEELKPKRRGKKRKDSGDDF